MNSKRFYDDCAAFYDADYEAAGYDEDVPFYVELARESGGPVLEMGCGTGRVLLAVAQAGIEISGIDGSARMLDRLKARLAEEPEAVRRRVRLLHGDIRTARVEGDFALVTAPFRVVQHLVERSDQRSWLRNVARHLRRDPPGALVFDVFQPDYALIGESPILSVDVEREDPATGRPVRRVARALHHPESQTFEVGFDWLVEGADGEERIETSVETVARWFTRPELELLLEIEGFEIQEFWGGFDRTPFGATSEDQVVRARLRS
jgi:SAM-dependent methyltransferase